MPFDTKNTPRMTPFRIEDQESGRGGGGGGREEGEGAGGRGGDGGGGGGGAGQESTTKERAEMRGNALEDQVGGPVGRDLDTVLLSFVYNALLEAFSGRSLRSYVRTGLKASKKIAQNSSKYSTHYQMSNTT